MKLPFINKGTFELHKSLVEGGEYIYIYIVIGLNSYFSNKLNFYN